MKCLTWFKKIFNLLKNFLLRITFLVRFTISCDSEPGENSEEDTLKEENYEK